MISQLITWETDTFLAAVVLGMILGAEYDCIRIFRRVKKHRHVWTMSVEDIIFWINVSILVFGFTYNYSDGVLRAFLVGALIGGAVLYRYAFGKFFVKYISKAIIFVLIPLKRILCFIIMIKNRVVKKFILWINKVRRHGDEAGNKKRKSSKD